MEEGSDNNCGKVTTMACNDRVMSQSIDNDHNDTKETEHTSNLNNTKDNGNYNKEEYFEDGEEMKDQYFEGYNNENWNNGRYYEDCDEVEYYENYGESEYNDNYCYYSYYGDGVDEITLNNIKYVLLGLIKATMKKEKVMEEAQIFLLSVLGLCSENQRHELMKINIEGNTPLSTCSKIRNLDLAKFLVENCNADVDGFSLMWAVYNSQKELLLYLLQQNADIGICFDNHYSLLMLALRIQPYDNFKMSHPLFKVREMSRDLAYIDSKLSNTLWMIYLCSKPNIEIIEILIKCGIIKKLPYINIFKCLAHCIDKRQTQIFSLIMEAIDEIDNIRDKKGCSILGYAIKMNNLQVVEELISKGADINNTKIMKYVKCDEIESQTLRSIVNHRWHSLLDSNKSNEELDIDSQVYIHPIVYCASTESRDLGYCAYGNVGINLDMFMYLMKHSQIDLEVKLDAVEILGAFYTIKRCLNWGETYHIASGCWNFAANLRSRLFRCGNDQMMDSSNDIDPDNEIWNKNVTSNIDVDVPDNKKLSSHGKNMDQNNKTTIECDVNIQSSDSMTATECNTINSNISDDINTTSILNPTDSSSIGSNPAERSRSNSVVSDSGGNDESIYSDLDGSDGEYGLENSDLDSSDGEYGQENSDWDSSAGHAGVYGEDFDNLSEKVQNVFDLLNKQDSEIGQKNINLPRSVFKNKLELCTKTELENLKPENSIDIATQSAHLYERLIGYDSESTIRALVNLGNLYKQNGDNEQYLSIMIYIIVCFREMTSVPNVYMNILRNLAFIASCKKDLYKLDISTEIMITKLFYMTNRKERNPNKEFSFLLSAIDKIRLYEKTEDELLDFKSLIRVVVKLDRRDEFGQSLLHYAALLKKTGGNLSSNDWMLLAFNGGSLSLTNFLLQYGVNPNTSDNEGLTPLHAVFKVLREGESLSFESQHESRKIVVSLVQAGGHLDCMDAYGKTAIDYSQNTSSPLCPVAHRSLQCLASCVIIKNNLKYEGHIPENLIEFVQFHAKRGRK